MTIESEQLVEKSKLGDSQAFSQLIHLYEDKIFNLTQKVCSTFPSEADDVYQETFLTAFKKIHQFRVSADLGTWLYRIASNLCFMRLRKKKREPVDNLTDASPENSGSDHPRVTQAVLKKWLSDRESTKRKRELAEAVSQALIKLPDKYRLVVTMKDIQSLSNESIAKTLNLSLPAVKSRLLRGRALLREYFLIRANK